MLSWESKHHHSAHALLPPLAQLLLLMLHSMEYPFGQFESIVLVLSTAPSAHPAPLLHGSVRSRMVLDSELALLCNN